MVRCSTPTHYFDMPFGSSDVKAVLVTYAQDEVIVLEKRETDVYWEGNVMCLDLTQEETKQFDDDKSVEIQIRVLTPKGKSIPSDIFSVPCGRVLNDEVMA